MVLEIGRTVQTALRVLVPDLASTVEILDYFEAAVIRREADVRRPRR